MPRILLYMPVSGALEERIQRMIGSQVQHEEIETYRTIEDLSQRLIQLGNKPSMAVLLAPTRKALLDLCSIRHLLLDLNIILILPDQEKDTIAKGHRFYPRLLSYLDGDFRDVAAVLGKMVKRKHSIGKH